MLEVIESFTVGEVIKYIVAIIGVLSVLVEWNKKIPWHPWSHIFSWVGKQFTKTIDEKIENLDRQVKDTNKAVQGLREDMERKFDEKQRNDDEKEMKRLRADIISFSDDCGRHTHHTKVHFENIFRVIDDYNKLCEEHNFPNHFIDGEVEYIKSVYEECLKDNKFLLDEQ